MLTKASMSLSRIFQSYLCQQKPVYDPNSISAQLNESASTSRLLDDGRIIVYERIGDIPIDRVVLFVEAILKGNWLENDAKQSSKQLESQGLNEPIVPQASSLISESPNLYNALKEAAMQCIAQHHDPADLFLEEVAKFLLQWLQQKSQQTKKLITQDQINYLQAAIQGDWGNKDRNADTGATQQAIDKAASGKRIISLPLVNEFDAPLPQTTAKGLTTVSQNQLIRNARNIFSFYCRQQMQLSPHSLSFERMQEEATQMNAGKFMTFAHGTQLIAGAITKKLALAKFKQHAEGKKCIDFDTFLKLLEDLNRIDTTVYERLKLVGANAGALSKVTKQYAFNTKDQQTRQLIAQRPFVHKITSHSGLSEESLRQILAERKRAVSEAGGFKSITKKLPKAVGPIRLSPRDMRGGFSPIEMSFIGNIATPEGDDSKWLGEYGPYNPPYKNSQMYGHASLGLGVSYELSRRIDSIARPRQQSQDRYEEESLRLSDSSDFLNPPHLIKHRPERSGALVVQQAYLEAARLQEMQKRREKNKMIY